MFSLKFLQTSYISCIVFFYLLVLTEDSLDSDDT